MFRLAYRQAEGLIGSIVGLLGLALRVPDHTTLSRRAATLEVPQPRPHAGRRGDAEPLHLLVDSTGLKLCGADEWLAEARTRVRPEEASSRWMPPLAGSSPGADRREVDDGAQAGPLLDQVAGTLASFIGDGGYDQDRVYNSVAVRHPEAAVIVPPRATAVPSEIAERPNRRSATGISSSSPRMAG